MPSNLRSTLTELAASFANNVLAALRGASLEDILSETAHLPGAGGSGRAPTSLRGRSLDGAGPTSRRAKPGGRLERRSADAIAQLVDRITDLVAKSPDGLRAEQIREALGLEAKELPRPLADALAAKKIVKQGQKRATTYFAKGAAPARKSAGKSAGRKSSKKKAD
ncbi:MAG: hypothetical protein U0169_18850 [Polyangiaceae bacterium]